MGVLVYSIQILIGRECMYIVKVIQEWYMIGVWMGGITVPVLITCIVKYKHA